MDFMHTVGDEIRQVIVGDRRRKVLDVVKDNWTVITQRVSGAYAFQSLYLS